MRTHPSVALHLAATTLACAAALTAGVSQADTYFAVLPLLGVDASQAKRPVKMVLARATPPTATVGVPYSFNLGGLLSLDGPEGTSPSNVRWSVVSGALPPGLELVGHEVVGMPMELAPDRQVVIQAEHVSGYSTDSVTAGYSFAVAPVGVVDFGGYRAWADGTYAQSCEGYIRSGSEEHPYQGATGSGAYRIAPPGAAPFDAYCDQVSDGGGWTRVALQYETSPVVWTGATSGLSYTLAQPQIPSHTYTAFGKGDISTFVDYVPFRYTTTNIPVTEVQSPKTGRKYQIHRSLIDYFESHDPELRWCYLSNDPACSVLWRATLTFDLAGVAPAWTWSFSPLHTRVSARGHAMAGAVLSASEDSYGWSVWVR